MQAGDRLFAQFKYYKLWPCKIKRVITVRDGRFNYEVCCYGTDESKIVTSDNIWRYSIKYSEAVKDGRKNVQRAIKLCIEDSDGLPDDLSESVLPLQTDLQELRSGVEDKIRKKVDEEFSKLDISPSQFKKEFLDTITQAVYKAIEMQFQSKFEQVEKALKDLRVKLVQNESKLEKLESKLDDLGQSALLNKVIVAGVETTARDLPVLGEKVLDRLNLQMGLQLEKSIIKGAKRLGANDQALAPIELTLISEAAVIEILRNRKMLKGSRVFVNEALTRERQEVFKLARNRFENKNVWTMRGIIFVKNGSQIIPCKTIADVA